MLAYETFFAIFIFSFVPLAVKVTSANPFTIGLFRLIVASFLTFILWRKKITFDLFFSKESWRLVLIGLCFFGHWMTYFYSIKIAGPSICVLGMSTYGIQLIFYGSVFLGYHVKKKNIVALSLVLAGISQLIQVWNFSNNFTQGIVLALISASFYSCLPILHQKTNQYFDHDQRIFSQFFFGLIGFSFFITKTSWQLSSKDWYALIFLAFFGTFIAHSLWARVTSKLPTTTSGIIYYAITPSALILSHFLLGESLTLKQIIAAGLILSGALYNSWRFHD
jgi:drug/metabolite transporter (DMT)-like permease